MTGQERSILHVRPDELRNTPPLTPGIGRLVAQLSSPGLGSTSYVITGGAGPAPEWIVLDYPDGHHERAWRRLRPGTEGVLSYTLVEDDSSSGYVTALAEGTRELAVRSPR